MKLPDKFNFLNSVRDECLAIKDVCGDYDVYNDGVWISTFTHDEIEKRVEDKTWTIIKDSNKLTEETPALEEIPKKFEMSDGISTWVVERQEDGSFTWLNTKYNTSGADYSEKEVQKWLDMCQITKIYEEEKPVARKYPDKFTMKSTKVGGVDYEYVYEDGTGRYKTIYAGNTYYNDENHFDCWIEKGMYKMIPAEYNGVDAEGKALNFTPGMLKPFMRVVTRNGKTYMVVNPYESGGVCMVGETGHISWYNPETANVFQAEYIVEEVYESPYSYQSLDLCERGKLIWKRQEAKPLIDENSTECEVSFGAFSTKCGADENIQKRLDYFQTHIDAVKENLESLQREYDELKQAVK